MQTKNFRGVDVRSIGVILDSGQPQRPCSFVFSESSLTNQHTFEKSLIKLHDASCSHDDGAGPPNRTIKPNVKAIADEAKAVSNPSSFFKKGKIRLLKNIDLGSNIKQASIDPVTPIQIVNISQIFEGVEQL